METTSRGEAYGQYLWVYAVLLALGTIIPFFRIVPWLVDHGLDVRLFVDELFANPVSSFFALDVIMAVVTLLVLAVLDRGLSSRQRIAVGLTALLGASVGLPAYLAIREWNRRTAIA
ncbi:MAG: DUF2834 domain-containing protein [Thermomicrobiales bacterium]|nr:DUF2834 domain-containing protein [Thermomicrobiales bacterium]